MRELNTTIVATRILTNRDYPIRHFFVDHKIQEEYVMKTPQPMFMKAIKIFGKQKIDVRKVETTPSYTRPPWLVNENEPIDLIMCAFLKERVGKESRQNFHHLWRTNTKNTIEYTRMDRRWTASLDSPSLQITEL
jgi:capsule polysaccharide modification protein KpsS